MNLDLDCKTGCILMSIIFFVTMLIFAINVEQMVARSDSSFKKCAELYMKKKAREKVKVQENIAMIKFIQDNLNTDFEYIIEKVENDNWKEF